VGHPMFDRYGPPPEKGEPARPTVVLLPGSRTDEIRRHLPVMLEAARKIAAAQPALFRLVAINEQMAAYMRELLPKDGPPAEIQVGRIAEALTGATMAISKTGTITLECAYFGVPTVTMYKVSPVFYFVAKMFVTVKYASMPNLLADGPIFPEFIQSQATAENIAEESLKLLSGPARRAEVRTKLRAIVASLGGPGSTRRAAEIISRFVD
jgi:lipid-A-disaccharide synthase